MAVRWGLPKLTVAAEIGSRKECDTGWETSSARRASPRGTRCFPQIHKSPTRQTGFGKRRRGIGSLFIRNYQKSIYLTGVEAREAEIEVGSIEFLHFQREQIFIPVCPGD